MPTGRPILTIALVVFLVVSTVVGASQLTIQSNFSVITSPSYIITIVMENHPLNVTINQNGVIGNPNATYITSLARNSSLAENYLSTNIGVSLQDYIALTAGNGNLVPNNCLPSLCTVNRTSVVDRIEGSGRTWKAYMEDLLPGQLCTYSGTGLGHYNVYHNPFVYYTNIQNNSTRCSAHVVPSNSGHSGWPDDILIKDLNNLTAAPNFIWLTPNNCDDMHGSNGCPTNIIGFADNYTRQLIPAVLNSLVFKTGKAALFITWDEPTFCGASCPIPAIWIGPTIRQHYLSNKAYNHYSYLSTIEALWSLPTLNANDAKASSMLEFFL